MDVALIEFRSDLEAAERAFEPSRSRYVALSAEAAFALSERGLEFLAEDDILSPDEWSALGERDFELTERWVEALESRLAAAMPSAREKAFEPFRWHFYRLKILMDAALTRARMLEKLFASEKPARVGLPRPCDPSRARDSSLFFFYGESLYGLLADKLAAGARRQTWGPPPALAPAKVGLARAARGVVNRAARLWSLRHGLLRPASANVLAATLDYGVGAALAGLNAPPRITRYEASVSSAPSSMPALAEEPFMGLSKTGVPAVDEILDARLRRYISRDVPELWRRARELEELDRRLDFRAYIDTAGASDAAHGLPVAHFQSRGKPVVVMQHGGYGYTPNRLTEYCEFGHHGTFLSWGAGVEQMYRERKRGKCVFEPTGSPDLETLRARRRPVKEIRTAAYLTTILRGYAGYIPHGQPFMDSGLFVETARRLKGLEPRLGRVELVVKVPPSDAKPSPVSGVNPLGEWVGRHLPNARVERRPLTDVIDGYDLIIMDWPSTSLLQACAAGKEIIVIETPYFPLEAAARELLSKRVVLARDTADFLDKAAALCARGTPQSDLEDTRFLERFGIVRDDGESSARLGAALERLIKR